MEALDSWDPLEPYACEACGSLEWDSDPKWREGTEAEKKRGWYRLPVLSPERSTCRGCGHVIVWAPA